MTASLSTYQNYIRTRVGLAVPWRRSDDVALLVAITGGLHEGSVATITDKRFVIGSAATDDIMLLDASAAGDNVTIAAESTVFGPMVTVQSARPDVTVNGIAIGTRDEQQTFRLPCQLRIGEVPIRLSADVSGQVTGLRPIEVGGIVVLSWVCILAIGTALNWGQPTQSQFAFVGSDGSDTVFPTTDAPKAPDAERITAMLQDAGLADDLRVVPKSAEALAVVGTLPADRMADWQAVRRQIDMSSDRMVVFSEIEETPSRPTIPAIASVRFGNDPALIFSNSQMARVGDTLEDGWVISAITETGFDLTRQGKDLSIAY